MNSRPNSLRRAPPATLTATLAVALSIGLAACASPSEEKVLRFNLGDGHTLAVRLPPGWTATPTIEHGNGSPRLGMLRLSSRVGDIPQMHLTPRVEPAQRQQSTAASNEERARRELTRTGECTPIGAELRARPMGGGIAVACSSPAGATRASVLTPVTAGVLAADRLTVRFAVLDAASDVAPVAWAILGGLRLESVDTLR